MTKRVFSNDVHFIPWIGDNYAKGIGGRKVLLVAESCYEWKENGRTNTPQRDHMTTQINDWILKGEETMQFYNNIWLTFSRAVPTLSSLADFWHRVAFHEYVQRPMASASARPTSADWEDAQQPFLEVARQLSPDCVFVLGYQLWTRLPQEQEAEAMFFSADEELWRCGYKFGSTHITPTYRLHHPSQGFSPDAWASCVKKALEYR